MFNKPWTMREGTAITAALVAAGIALQAATGPVAWEALAWPVNIIVLAAGVAAVVVARLLAPRCYALRFVATLPAAVPAIIAAVVLTTAMGLTPQTHDGSWLSSMLTFWPFVVVYAYVTFILALATAKRICLRPGLADAAFVLNHAGLCLAIVAATLGAPDIQRLKMMAFAGTRENRAMDEQRRMVTLPISVELRRFILETHPDGSPRRFASDIVIRSASGQEATATVDVNHPVRLGGWKIYQYGYDTEAGAESRLSILELVRDPWQPAVYAGIFMMLAGALLMLFMPSTKHNTRHTP